MGLWWVVGLTLIWSAFLLTTLPASAQSFKIFVPMVSTDNPTDNPGPGSTGRAPAECLLNSEEQKIANLMLADAGQQRNNPVCDPILAQVARARAKDMATRNYFAHTNPNGDGPNLLAREAGYPLPDWYGSKQDSNNIESIGGGYESPNNAWQGWLKSPKHNVHVLGTEPFYQNQDAYGVGYYYNADSTYQHYWVFLSAPVAD
jgi:hypothetical protein